MVRAGSPRLSPELLSSNARPMASPARKNAATRVESAEDRHERERRRFMQDARGVPIGSDTLVAGNSRQLAHDLCYCLLELLGNYGFDQMHLKSRLAASLQINLRPKSAEGYGLHRRHSLQNLEQRPT